MTDATEHELELQGKMAVEGGAIKLTDMLGHPGQEPVARFHAWIDERECVAELRVGDVAQAGNVAFELVSITPRSSVTIALRELAGGRDDAPFGEAVDIRLGQRFALPTGQVLQLTAVGHYGIQLRFKASNGCANYTWFDFGFWREDGLLFEVESFDRAHGTARLTINLEADVDQQRPVGFGEVVSLGPRDVARYPDGTTVRLRRAERQSYDAVDWRLFAENGDDVSYPYAGSINMAGEPESGTDRSFSLLGRAYGLRPRGMVLRPAPSLRLVVDCSDALNTFSVGVAFQLTSGEYYEGPDGLRVGYRGCGHGHGTSMGADGELVPMTSAWADFAVVKDGVSSGFGVDLMEFDESRTEQLFGYLFTVRSVDDQSAVVEVRKPGPDADRTDVPSEEESSSPDDAEPEATPRAPRSSSLFRRLMKWLSRKT